MSGDRAMALGGGVRRDGDYAAIIDEQRRRYPLRVSSAGVPSVIARPISPDSFVTRNQRS